MSETATLRDNVMTECRNLLRNKIRQHAGATRRDDELGWLWPGTTESLAKRVEAKTEPFWDSVVESHTIDIAQFGLRTNKVKFTFVDPVFVWIQQANALANAGYELHWRPRTLSQGGTNERLYGAGIQYGQLMEAACNSIPIGCRVGLINLSWDGGETAMKSFSATPICVQVLNCNTASMLSVGIVSYVPVIDGLSDAQKQTLEFRQASRHVLQECVGLLLERIEATSRGGFKCHIGSDQNNIICPKVVAMTLDTPERVKYFGLRSKRACGDCRFRKGRSAARLGSRHDPLAVKEALERAISGPKPLGPAREQAKRRGWDFKKPCRLNEFANRILVQIPGQVERMYGGLINYDNMHVIDINFCTYLLENVSALVPKEQFPTVRGIVQQCHQFRDPVTGTPHPRLQSVLKMTHLTAERRVRAVFYWGHVLGTNATVIPDAALRQHAQAAVSTLQLLLISTRGHRAYTERELKIIYGDVGTQFFRHLEALAEHNEAERMRKGLRAAKNPRNRPPIAYAKSTVANDESDTTETDEELGWGGIGRFEYGLKGLPHAIVHGAETLMRAGHHGAYDTNGVEAYHKVCIKKASKYARTYASRNSSQEHMLLWVLRDTLWRSVIELNEQGADPSRAPQGLRRRIPDTVRMCPLPDTQWQDVPRGRAHRAQRLQIWLNTFFRARVLITHQELLAQINNKLQWRGDFMALKTKLTWEFHGVLSMKTADATVRRKFVGLDKKFPNRRDYVRIKGREDDTALSAQIIMFVTLSGFRLANEDADDRVLLPVHLQNGVDNHTLTLAVIRWLSPHREAFLRDKKGRPVAPPPMDINHALWTFTKLASVRSVMNNRNRRSAVFRRQARLFKGPEHIDSLTRARYDVVPIATLEHFINCTLADEAGSKILETITIPF